MVAGSSWLPVLSMYVHFGVIPLLEAALNTFSQDVTEFIKDHPGKSSGSFVPSLYTTVESKESTLHYETPQYSRHFQS